MGTLIKPKKCKGTGRAKNYEGCGQLKFNHKYGLCMACFNNWLYNTPEGKEVLNKALKQGKNKVIQQEKKQRAEEKREATDPRPILQKKINEIVRLIDFGMPCLARRVSDNRMNAGHIYSVGSNPALRFNLHNIHRQSAVSNNSQLDDGKMRLNAGVEYGVQYGEFIDQLKTINTLKLSRTEMKEKIKNCQQIINELKPNLKLRTPSERLELRNKFNQEIGIYPNKYSVFKLKEKIKH